jgi:hypothetical protein
MGSYTYELLADREEQTGNMKTGFLFAGPSVWSGAGRLLDMGCTFDVYNYSASEQEADAKAIYSDWLMVGNDISAALRYYEQWTDNSQAR